MYEGYYKLSVDPFRLLPDADVCFPHRSCAKAWAYLQYALQRGEGIVVVTGPPGSGKTTLAARVVRELNPAETIGVSIVADEPDPTELLRELAFAFGLRAENADHATLAYRIKCHLNELERTRRRALLVIDEAQTLSQRALEAMRLLTDQQALSHPILQLFLLGQTELEDALLAPELEQLQQRVVASCRLQAMDLAETKGYMEHRLTHADWRGDPSIDGAAVMAVFRYSKGNPRHVNKICSRLLLHGSADEKHALQESDVLAVVLELRDELLAPLDDPLCEGATPAPAPASVKSLALTPSYPPEPPLNRAPPDAWRPMFRAQSRPPQADPAGAPDPDLEEWTQRQQPPVPGQLTSRPPGLRTHALWLRLHNGLTDAHRSAVRIWQTVEKHGFAVRGRLMGAAAHAGRAVAGRLVQVRSWCAAIAPKRRISAERVQALVRRSNPRGVMLAGVGVAAGAVAMLVLWKPALEATEPAAAAADPSDQRRSAAADTGLAATSYPTVTRETAAYTVTGEWRGDQVEVPDAAPLGVQIPAALHGDTEDASLGLLDSAAAHPDADGGVSAALPATTYTGVSRVVAEPLAVDEMLVAAGSAVVVEELNAIRDTRPGSQDTPDLLADIERLAPPAAGGTISVAAPASDEPVTFGDGTAGLVVMPAGNLAYSQRPLEAASFADWRASGWPDDTLLTTLPASEVVSGPDTGATVTAAAPSLTQGVQAAEIERLIALGDDAARQDRLLFPEHASAHHYYRRALALDADNQAAAAGIARIVQRYRKLAEQTMADRAFDKARLFIARALRVRPGDPETSRLRARLDDLIADTKAAEAAQAELARAELARMAAEQQKPSPPELEPAPPRTSNFRRLMQGVD